MARTTKSQSQDVNALVAAAVAEALAAQNATPEPEPEPTPEPDISALIAAAVANALGGNVPTPERKENLDDQTFDVDDGGAVVLHTVTHYGPAGQQKSFKSPRIRVKSRRAGTDGSMSGANLPLSVVRFIRSDAFAKVAAQMGHTV